MVTSTKSKKSPAKRSPAKRSPAKRSPAKRSPAKRSPAKRSPAKRSPAKRSPAKRSPAKRSPAKRSPAKRSPAKRSPAKRSPAKRSPAKRSPAKRSPAKRSPKGYMCNAPIVGNSEPCKKLRENTYKDYESRIKEWIKEFNNDDGSNYNSLVNQLYSIEDQFKKDPILEQKQKSDLKNLIHKYNVERNKLIELRNEVIDYVNSSKSARGRLFKRKKKLSEQELTFREQLAESRR